MALAVKGVLRLLGLLRQNERLRDELGKISLPPNFGAWRGCVDERLTGIKSATEGNIACR
ncbi:MAG: hypothetical protein RMK89_01805 [Armatimonadota bacterium]|nr:hypothetical protein [Armatimonadota bacterium]MDW8142175.1 hypothetical protein [Armatimonadota bacterium]